MMVSNNIRVHHWWMSQPCTIQRFQRRLYKWNCATVGMVNSSMMASNFAYKNLQSFAYKILKPVVSYIMSRLSLDWISLHEVISVNLQSLTTFYSSSVTLSLTNFHSFYQSILTTLHLTKWWVSKMMARKHLNRSFTTVYKTLKMESRFRLEMYW